MCASRLKRRWTHCELTGTAACGHAFGERREVAAGHVKRGVMMRSIAWMSMAVVLAVVGADGKEDPIKKIRKIHLASNSAKVVSEITDTPGCVSLSESKDPADATLDIQCEVGGTFRVVGIGIGFSGGKIIRATRKGWDCEAKLSPLSGNVIWAKSKRGRTDQI